jgi:DNA repair exonuclease SbcCD ATPase subunit
MRNILFNKISIKNFLSVGNVPVTVDFKRGLHIITGINKDKEDRRNGVGKSTVADAIYFAVFGETLRDLKKENIINNVNRKNCEVILDLTIQNLDKKEEIQIIRTLEPSKCFIYVNGEDKTRDSISNTNSAIMSKFNSTPEVFQNCVIMTINNTIPFMAKKKLEKRKFIEDIFNLGIFSGMLNLLKADITEKKKSFDIEATKHDEVQKTILSYEKQKESSAVERQKKKEKYVLRQESNTKEIKQINKLLKEFKLPDIDTIKKDIEEQEGNSTKVDKKLQEIRHSISENTTLIAQLNKKISSVGTDKDVCPTCLRSIQDVDRNHIKEEKKKINCDIESHETTITKLKTEEKQYLSLQSKLEEKIQTLRDNLNNYKHKVKEKQNLEDRLKQLTQWQTELEQDLKDIENDSNTFDSLIKEQTDRLDAVKGQIDTIKQTLNTLDVVKFVVSEEGVKSYIVKKILQLFNSKLAYYLKKMDANCICTFNEYFEEEIVDNKGKECSYFNFSGAERKNIDLACLFTFMDIRRLQGDVSFNFSIYDELFDSSLDERGVELVINILKERVEKYNECIMVISHRKESIKAATGDIIFLEKSNGITRRVDYKEYKG